MHRKRAADLIRSEQSGWPGSLLISTYKDHSWSHGRHTCSHLILSCVSWSSEIRRHKMDTTEDIIGHECFVGTRDGSVERLAQCSWCSSSPSGCHFFFPTPLYSSFKRLPYYIWIWNEMLNVLSSQLFLSEHTHIPFYFSIILWSPIFCSLRLC